MESPTISSTQLAALVGVSYRKLDHWSRAGIIVPTVEALGSGRPRAWSLDDTLRTKVCVVLRRAGLSLSASKQFLGYLDAHPRLWEDTVSVGPDGRLAQGDGWHLDLAALRAQVVERFPADAMAS